MNGSTWQLVWFSVRMALGSLALVLPVGTTLAWLLARKEWRGQGRGGKPVSLSRGFWPASTAFHMSLPTLRVTWLLDGSLLHRSCGIDPPYYRGECFECWWC